MTAYFVSRHKGAIEWARAQGIEAVFIEHLEAETVQPGDRVYGTLPVSEAAKVCARGARYFHLILEVSSGVRGSDFTVSEMKDLKARLAEYFVKLKEA